MLFRSSPVPLHAWRRGLLRLFGAKIGRGVHIYPRVEIWAPWNITAEDFVGVANGATLYSMAEIYLGERCVVSQGAHLCTGSHDYNDPTFQLFANPIRIERRAWICAEAYLAPGVLVTEGVVVGARSVVTCSLTEAWKVYAGVPARVIGDRARNALPTR